MTAINITTASACIGEPEIDVEPGRPLRIWPGGRPGVLLTISVVDWYTLVAAVNEKLEAGL